MILLVGYGYWGKNLARNFTKELSVVCDKDIDLLHTAKQVYPRIAIYNDYDLALQHPGIKAVLIATKTNEHLQMASKAIQHGYDVWIEKPVCATLDEVDQLIKVSEEHNKLVFVDHTFCYHPAVEKMKSIDIGQPLYYDSTRISLGLFQPDVDVLLDLAIHDVSIINYLYPDIKLADRKIIKNAHINKTANQAVVLLKYNNGFTANINVNWVSPVKKRQIILAGSTASVVYDDIDNDKIKVYETGEIADDFNANSLGDMYSPKVGTQEALYVGRTHFLDCIKTRQQPHTNIYKAKQIMEWLL